MKSLPGGMGRDVDDRLSDRGGVLADRCRLGFGQPMTLLVILGIVVLGIGCLLADWRLDNREERTHRRGFKRW